MSRRRPVHPRTVVQVALFAVAVVLLVTAIRFVRATAPETTLPPIAEAAPLPGADELVTCERTLPAAPETLEEAAEVEPIGLVQSSEVIECPTAFDGHVVHYVGEVVGDVLQRDGGAWLLVNDDAYALEVGPLQGHSQFRGTNSGLAVWLPAPLPELEPGGADVRGTVIRVQGVVRRADPADGGGLTIRGLTPTSTTIVAEAERIDRPVHRGQVVLALVLALLATALWIVERRARTSR